jgi:hypothetical protein
MKYSQWKKLLDNLWHFLWHFDSNALLCWILLGLFSVYGIVCSSSLFWVIMWIQWRDPERTDSKVWCLNELITSWAPMVGLTSSCSKEVGRCFPELGINNQSWSCLNKAHEAFFFFFLVSISQCPSPDRYRQTYLDMYLEFKRYHSTLAALTLIIVFRSVEIFTPKTTIPRTKFCEGKYWIFGNIFIFIKWEMKN